MIFDIYLLLAITFFGKLSGKGHTFYRSRNEIYFIGQRELNEWNNEIALVFRHLLMRICIDTQHITNIQRDYI